MGNVFDEFVNNSIILPVASISNPFFHEQLVVQQDLPKLFPAIEVLDKRLYVRIDCGSVL
jgi:hypothetical protein